jgi:pimeloyl-ACP methyl ester carboxylesterase
MKKLIVATACVVMALVGASGARAVECLRPPLPEALDALTSSAAVAVSIVEVDSWDGETPAPPDDNIYYAFAPKHTKPGAGFMILPGGNCDPRSYAPAAHAIAAKGFFACIIPVPSCVAMLGYMRGDRIIYDQPQIAAWVMGGHSVGGTAAGTYAKASGKLSGVVIWASLADPASKLNEAAIKVLSVYGSLDGRATPEQVRENAVYLPADAILVEIEGGNHTQFGWIDPYPNAYIELDNAATITIEEQQEILVAVTADFLKQFVANRCPITYLLGEEDARLDTARRVRNQLLVKSAAGREMIAWYTRNGASMIALFEKSPMIKEVARTLVGAAVSVMERVW